MAAAAGKERLGAQGDGPGIDDREAIEGDRLVVRGTVGMGGHERTHES